MMQQNEPIRDINITHLLGTLVHHDIEESNGKSICPFPPYDRHLLAPLDSTNRNEKSQY
jgi:hypothetical protein